MENKVLHIDHRTTDLKDSGSKIPITIVEAVYRDPDDHSILYKEVAVLSGHNIPSDQLEKIREVLRAKLKHQVMEGSLNDKPIRRIQQEQI